MATITKIRKSTTKSDQVQQQYKADTGTVETTITEWYQIEFDTAGSKPVALNCLSATDGSTTIPTAGTTAYSGFPTIICSRVQPQRSGSAPYIFDVQVEYSTLVAKLSTPPTDTTAKWGVSVSFDANEIQETVDKDINGTAIRNSCHEPFDPPLSQTFYEEEIVVSFNTYSPNEAALVACRGKINNAPLTMSINGYNRLFDVGTLRLLKAPFKTSTEQGANYFTIELHFRYRPQVTIGGSLYSGWQAHVIDRGWNMLDSSAPDGKRPIKIGYSQEPIKQPAFLDGTGKPLASGATPNFLHFTLIDQTDFSAMLAGLSEMAYGFDEAGVKRIVSAVRDVERQSTDGTLPPHRQTGAENGKGFWAKITGLSFGGITGGYLYAFAEQYITGGVFTTNPTGLTGNASYPPETDTDNASFAVDDIVWIQVQPDVVSGVVYGIVGGVVIPTGVSAEYNILINVAFDGSTGVLKYTYKPFTFTDGLLTDVGSPTDVTIDTAGEC